MFRFDDSTDLLFHFCFSNVGGVKLEGGSDLKLIFLTIFEKKELGADMIFMFDVNEDIPELELVKLDFLWFVS